MKKILFVCGWCTALSLAIYTNASEFTAVNAAPPDFKNLAALYQQSDPHVLATPFKTATATTSIVETRAPKPKRTATVESAQADFHQVNLADYVFLHYLRVESAPVAAQATTPGGGR